MRRQFTPEQKAAVAFAALKGDKTINQVASEFEVNPTQVKHWRDAVKIVATEAFADKRKSTAKVTDTQKQVDELHRVIGLRDAELEWLKKRSVVNWGASPFVTHATYDRFRPGDLSALIEPEHPFLTVTRQVELPGLHRQTYYYSPVVNTTAQALLRCH